MTSKYIKKIGDDKSYKRPKHTLQETLSSEEINNKLQGYERVQNISEVPLNTHIRYFSYENGNYVFRLGGFLKNKQNSDKYVVLTNGKIKWTVQVPNTIFYKKMSHSEEIEAIHEMYRKKLEEKDRIILKLKKFIKDKGLINRQNSTTTKGSKQGKQK